MGDAVAIFVTAVMLFGLAFEFVHSLVFIIVGMLALGAGVGVLCADHALRSSESHPSSQPRLARVVAILLTVGVTWGGLGTLRFATQSAIPPGTVNLLPGNPFASVPPSLSPSESPRTAAQLPYEADWSKGLAGWAVSPNWTLVDGVLTNDGRGRGNKISAIAPIDLATVRDYVVEADIELVRYGDNAPQSFGFVVRSNSDKSGYRVGYCSFSGYLPCDNNGPDYEAGIWDAGTDTTLVSAKFQPPAQSWHHYRVVVKANVLTFTAPDVGIDLSTSDNAYLAADQVGLWAMNCQISVRNFTVSAAP